MATDDPLWIAIRAAHTRWSPGTAERFPPNSRWEPLAGEVGTDISSISEEFKGAVPAVPTVPTTLEDTCKETGANAHDAARGAWDERAAILEFEGGLSRAEAERMATEELSAR